MGRWSNEEHIMHKTCPSGTFWALRDSGIKTFKDLFDMTAEQYLDMKELNNKRVFTVLKEFAIQQCKENNAELPDWADKIRIAKSKGNACILYIPDGGNDIRNHITYENALLFMNLGINTIDELLTLEPEEIIKLQGVGNVRAISIFTDICMYRNDGTTVQYYIDRINKSAQEESHKLEERKAAANRLDELGANIDVNIYAKGNDLYVDNYMIDLNNPIFMTREAQILKLRYIDKKTLEELGKMFGVTRERIRQILEKSKVKITRYYRRMIVSLKYPSVEFNPKSINKEMFILKEVVTNGN